jgi:hypothetical protein
MKPLLIAYYWYPYNNSGTFRWTNFSRYIDFDVLTTKNPMRSFRDFTMNCWNPYTYVFQFGNKIPAILWGLTAPFFALFKKASIYIFTSPPESLIVWAWLFQLMGRKVLVDMRDSIDREAQYFKRLIPIYKFFYKRMKHVVVSYQFLDESKQVIYSGYEDIKCTTGFRGYYRGRYNRANYLYKLEQGYMPDQHNKPSGYGSGSVQTFRHLGFPLNNDFHPEVNSHRLRSIQESANEMTQLINKIKE